MRSTPSASPFGLIAQLAKTRIHLPLTHVETRFRIMGDIASVELEQVFEQTARESLDVTYTFPLPGNAAVHRCEMIVNSRTIRAVVMEEKEARRTVAEKKAAGHRTALVEVDRDNLFTLQLGNAAPGDRIIIRFAYIERLDRLGTQLSLRIPFSPGVRYIPGKPLLRANRGLGSTDDTDQVPDASRLTPPRISGDHPDAATLYLHGVLDDSEVDLRTLSSPTHPAILRSSAGQIEVDLAGEEHLPDRDFVLRWDEEATDVPAAKSWSTTHDGHTYALLQLRAPQFAAINDEFVQDIYFLLDRSGSMDGLKWVKCAEALHAFVRVLGPRDRVWITCFESDYQDFADDLMPRDELLADQGFQSLADIGTAGGTELLPALEHVLAKRRALGRDRAARCIVITDGQVGNEEAIKALMKRPEHAGLPVHCFGIDDAVNDAFLKSLSRITGGRCALMTPNDDIPAAVERLAETLRRPVLTQLMVQGDAITTNDNARLADLHAGEVTIVAVRMAANAREAAFGGRLPDGTAWSQRFVLEPETENQSPRLTWAHRRSRHLLGTGRRKDALQIAITHNLVCKGASFVAWDEAEKVPLAVREVYQPSMQIEMAAAPRLQFSMRRSLVSPAPEAADDANFFESKVTEYQKTSVLRECSDDELCAPIGKGDGGGIKKWLGSILGSVAGIKQSESHDATKLKTILAAIEKRHGRFVSTDPNDLDAWDIQLHDALVHAGLEREIASAFTRLFQVWTKQIISPRRREHLAELAAALKNATSPRDALQTFIDEHITGDLLNDLRHLLAEIPKV